MKKKASKKAKKSTKKAVSLLGHNATLKVCLSCGSTNVVLPAELRWNPRTRKWVAPKQEDLYYQNPYCKACNKPTWLREMDINLDSQDSPTKGDK